MILVAVVVGIMKKPKFIIPGDIKPGKTTNVVSVAESYLPESFMRMFLGSGMEDPRSIRRVWCVFGFEKTSVVMGLSLAN